MKPPVILFDPEVRPEVTRTPADYYRNIFSPGVEVTEDPTATPPASTNSTDPRKGEGSKP